MVCVTVNGGGRDPWHTEACELDMEILKGAGLSASPPLPQASRCSGVYGGGGYYMIAMVASNHRSGGLNDRNLFFHRPRGQKCKISTLS